jgi:RHS repeat-associated protein
VEDAGPGAPIRKYGPGGRLHARGDVEYHWDPAGQLAARVERAGTAEERVWRYSWDGTGRLAEVRAPDGKDVSFVYDALSRRVLERVRQRDKLISLTRYVWDGDVLLHEIWQGADAEGDPIVEERTYFFEDDSFTPWAHREVRHGRKGRGAPVWSHYVTDPIGTPEALVDPAGKVVYRADRKLWGKTSAREGSKRTTPLRFPGQYEDGETGLFYNRFRYYDPEAGIYIGPDPIGLLGGPRPYGYVDNPLREMDPFGLGQDWPAASTRITLTDGTTISGNTLNRDPEMRAAGGLHPVVASAIPSHEAARVPNERTRNNRGNCAEAVTLSRLLDRQGVPRQGYTEEQVRAANGMVERIETTMPRTGTPKPACEYCRGMMSAMGISYDRIVTG